MFTPEARRIFGPYLDANGQQLFADPVAVSRLLNAETGGNLNQYIDQYNAGDDRAAMLLADAAISAFGLAPFDRKTGVGTLQDEALNLLVQFLHWRGEKKTPPASLRTSAPSTAAPGSPVPEYERRVMELAGRKPMPGRPDSISQPSTPSG